jgi:hypothetical protein
MRRGAARTSPPLFVTFLYESAAILLELGISGNGVQPLVRSTG